VNRNLQGLCKPSSDAIAKARDDTGAQVSRISLTLVGTAIFCLLSLFTPDSALLAGNERLNLPLAGPVSFVGFMLLGPAVLIVLRVYLQIYVEHERRLDRIARWMSAARVPTLKPDRNPLLRTFNGFVLYLLLPLAMLSFSLKTAVFPYSGTGLLSVAVAVSAMHLMLRLRRSSWHLRAALSLGAAILTGAVMMSFAPVSRPFNLRQANLSDQWFYFLKLKGADLSGANLVRTGLFLVDLTDAHLVEANLVDSECLSNFTRADLTGANLTNASLRGSNFTGARFNHSNLTRANLTHANLAGANFASATLSVKLTDATLTDTNFSAADLHDSLGLTQQQLDTACGDPKTTLPPGLKLPQICR
jgi:hypothetical protein